MAEVDNGKVQKEKPVVILDEVVPNSRSQVVESPCLRTNNKMSKLRKVRASNLNLPDSDPGSSSMEPKNLEIEEPLDKELRSKYASNDQTVKPPITDKEPLKIQKDLTVRPKLSLTEPDQP